MRFLRKTTVPRSLGIKCEEQVLDMLHARQQSRRRAEIYLGRKERRYSIKICINMFSWSKTYDLWLGLLSLSYTLESPWLRIAPTENTKCICIIYSILYTHTYTHTHVHKYKFNIQYIHIAYLQKTGYNAFVPTIVRKKYLSTGVPSSRKQTWATLLYRTINRRKKI